MNTQEHFDVILDIMYATAFFIISILNTSFSTMYHNRTAFKDVAFKSFIKQHVFVNRIVGFFLILDFFLALNLLDC